MRDIELAKSWLQENDLTLVIVNEGKVVFETKLPGITGLLQAIVLVPTSLNGSAVADKILGAAAAMLCVYAGVASVFASTISREGIRVLDENKVSYQFETQVLHVLNKYKTDICPFEKLALESNDPKEAYVKLKSYLTSLTS